MHYNIELKKKLWYNICINGDSTIKTAEEFNVPLKTLEKWITAFNKNSYYFDKKIESNDFKLLNKPNTINYDELSNDELIKQLMKKDIEIARLKKGYIVKEGGTGRKVFVTFSKKNMKWFLSYLLNTILFLYAMKWILIVLVFINGLIKEGNLLPDK